MSALPGLDVCPACGANKLEPFSAQDSVPVHSCRLLSRREDALAFPLGALRLAVCRSCGFVTNTAYDPSLQDYAESYEETQGFSPRFRQFAEALAHRLIERYGIRDRDVLRSAAAKASSSSSSANWAATEASGSIRASSPTACRVQPPSA